MPEHRFKLYKDAQEERKERLKKAKERRQKKKAGELTVNPLTTKEMQTKVKKLGSKNFKGPGMSKQQISVAMRRKRPRRADNKLSVAEYILKHARA